MRAKLDVVEDLPGWIVAELDMIELDPAFGDDERLRVFFVDVLAHLAARQQDIEHALDVDTMASLVSRSTKPSVLSGLHTCPI